jgi:hypothetical protein
MTPQTKEQLRARAELRNEISASIYGLYYYELPHAEQKQMIRNVMSKVDTHLQAIRVAAEADLDNGKQSHSMAVIKAALDKGFGGIDDTTK